MRRQQVESRTGLTALLPEEDEFELSQRVSKVIADGHVGREGLQAPWDRLAAVASSRWGRCSVGWAATAAVRDGDARSAASQQLTSGTS